jgi:hypothetical protein
VLVTLSLIAVVLADAAGATVAAGWVARPGIPLLSDPHTPTGFFLSSMGAGRTGPNGPVALLWIGALSLTAGTLTLGVLVVRSSLVAGEHAGEAVPSAQP